MNVNLQSSPKVLIIAATTGYQARAFADAASRAGIGFRLATDRCHVLENPWGDSAIPLRFETPQSAGRLVARTGERWDGIVAVGDQPAYVAALIAAELGLPFHLPDAVAASKDKFLARERFAAAGLLTPGFQRIPLDAPHYSGEYPCILKPLGLSGSRGVIRANDGAGFAQAFERIRRILHERTDRELLVEEFIPGREFALEGLMTRGRLDIIAIFDKPDPLDGPYFEETIYVTPSRAPSSIQAAIIDTTTQAVAALGLTHGPIHAEMRVNERGVWMLEVAARPIGGLCAQALRFESGQNLEELILWHAVGTPRAVAVLSPPARGVMMIPIPKAGVYTRVSGLDEARAAAGIEQVVITAKEGQTLLPLPEGASYLGFIFAAGDNPAFVEHSLREAHSCLEFELASVLPVVT